jgi:hypothetical protein
VSEVIEKVSKVADKYNIPEYVWKPIMLLESGGNPNARAYVSSERAKELKQGAEDSRGLFQINIFAHPNANSTKLYDPEYNAEYSFKNIIGPATQQGIEKGLTGWELTRYVEKYGQRPKWTEKVESALFDRYTKVTGGSPDLTLVTSLKNAPIEGNTKEGNFFRSLLPEEVTPDYWKTLLKTGVYGAFLYIAIFLLLIFALYKVFENEKVTKFIKEEGTKLALGGL